MRRALAIGVDHYVNPKSNLYGAVSDATRVCQLLDRDEDGSKNFDTRLIVSTPSRLVHKAELRDSIKELFSGKGDLATLYYAGHGYAEDTGGYLCPSDSESGDDGIPIQDIMTWANQSKFLNRIIILDSCHSGAAGSRPTQKSITEIAEGVTILTASTADQYALESGGGGVFTNLLVDALSGAACNLLGAVTPGSVYAHVDQSLANWGQRPMFKTNVENFVSLRNVNPPIDPLYLRRIAEFFPTPEHHFALDPSFEPQRSEQEAADPDVPAPDPINTTIFAILQEYARVGLLRPDGAPHMWHAAMGRAGARLTRLGEHYRLLALSGRL